jgi:cytochrome c5
MRIIQSVAITVMLSVSMLASQAVRSQSEQKNEASKTSAKKTASARVDPQQQPEGERIFQQHCSRCHNAPEGFSPRISGTIARHMRVRASLSKHEEEELLRFLNP